MTDPTRARRYLGVLYRRVPEQRRTTLRCPGAWRLATTKLLGVHRRWPVTVGTPGIGRYRLGLDPVDERVLCDLLHNKRQLYFPASRHVLPPGPLVLDVGAHHGFYATAALLAYPGSRLIAVEPNPQALPRIRSQLVANGLLERARLVHAALADAAGTGHLKLCRRGSWGDSLYETEDVVGTVRVPLLTLAEILDGEKPDLVKCNAEGGEFALVRQLHQLDPRPALLVIMVHEEFGDRKSLVDHLELDGYRTELRGSALRPVIHAWRGASSSTPAGDG